MHAWTGVGSLNPVNDNRSSSGISSCENRITGGSGAASGGVCIVIECFSRKAAASPAVAGVVEVFKGAEEDSAKVDGVV